MQENKQHTHKIVTQDISWETLIEGKTQPPKASILHCINQPRVTMNTSETSSPPMHFHVSKHESTHPMPCFTNALFRKTQSANLLSLFTFLHPPAYLKPLHCVCFYRNKLTQNTTGGKVKPRTTKPCEYITTDPLFNIG